MKRLIPLLTVLGALTVQGGDWVNISDSFTAALRPGYGGPTSGIVVDRADGAVSVVVSDLGLWRSTDHGVTFARSDGGAVTGRGETGWALHADPNGKRIACFMVYGESGITTDGGRTWTKFTTSHLDFGSVDWADSGRRLLALRHESGGVLTTSEDGGKTWKDLGKGFSGCAVIDRTTFAATKEKEPGIFRSTDAGGTWTKVHAVTPGAAVPVAFAGALWWPAGDGLLISRDKGATWKTNGAAVEALYGPFFKTADHFMVAGKAGFFETRDGGGTWTKAAPLPEGFHVNRTGPFYTWDPDADILYASMMTKPSFKLERKRKAP